MDFFLVGMLMWTLVLGSVCLFLWGFWKKSWIAFFSSGFGFLLPALMFATVDSPLRFLVLFPIVSFLLAYYMNRKYSTSTKK